MAQRPLNKRNPAEYARRTQVETATAQDEKESAPLALEVQYNRRDFRRPEEIPEHLREPCELERALAGTVMVHIGADDAEAKTGRAVLPGRWTGSNAEFEARCVANLDQQKVTAQQAQFAMLSWARTDAAQRAADARNTQRQLRAAEILAALKPE